MPAGKGVRDDHARSVDAQMELLPAAHTASAMFHGRPFPFAGDRESRTVDDEMKAAVSEIATECEVEPLAASRERRVIGRRQIEAQHPEDRRQKALGLAEGEMKDEAKRQRRFDGEVGLQLPSTLADARGLPRGNCFRC